MGMSKGFKALATGGLSLLGGGGGGGSTNRAMMRMIAENTAKAEQDFSPYVSGGKSAQEQMMAQLGLGGPAQAFDVTQLPGYQNALQQGLSAVNQGGAGAGMLMSGERLKGLQSTGQNIFGSYYNNYLDRLTGMSSQGLRAAGGLADIRSGGLSGQLGVMQNQQQQKASQFGDLLGLAGTVGGMMVGGPAGAAVGGSLGSMAGAGTGGGGYSGGYPSGALSMIGF